MSPPPPPLSPFGRLQGSDILGSSPQASLHKASMCSPVSIWVDARSVRYRHIVMMSWSRLDVRHGAGAAGRCRNIKFGDPTSGEFHASTDTSWPGFGKFGASSTEFRQFPAKLDSTSTELGRVCANFADSAKFGVNSTQFCGVRSSCSISTDFARFRADQIWSDFGRHFGDFNRCSGLYIRTRCWLLISTEVSRCRANCCRNPANFKFGQFQFRPTLAELEPDTAESEPSSFRLDQILRVRRATAITARRKCRPVV